VKWWQGCADTRAHEQYPQVIPFEEGRRKLRDADKLHQGFALVRFERAATVELVSKALDGLEMGPGSRGKLTASVSRSRITKENAVEVQEKALEDERQAQLEKKRKHNLGQKRRRVERMEQELESLLGKIGSPGGHQAIKEWRCLAAQGAKAIIDWDRMPAECDPRKTVTGGAKESKEAAKERALRKCVQVMIAPCITAGVELLLGACRASPKPLAPNPYSPCTLHS